MNDNIFKMCHSNYEKLIPLKDLKNKEHEELIIKNGLDINKFYKVEGKFHPYCYINNTVYVEIYSLNESDFNNLRVKEMIEKREQMHEECIEDKDYERLFIYIDKPYRMDWYVKLFNEIPNDRKYEIFRGIYSSMEYGFDNIDRQFLDKIFKYNNLDRKQFDDITTIYRGETEESTPYNYAYSWTTDLKTAEWFANRFDSDGVVYKGYVKKEHILDYIEDRKESEILAFPENVFNVELLE
ncbi:hypothetical protein FC831_15215 [Clostridium botulinum]|nr:hypothetical protein [Clostridium botulinum]